MIKILMATYNGERYLREQIDSILNQTYTDWQLIIADDGSTDATLDIVNEYVSAHANKISLLEKPDGMGAKGSFEYLLQSDAKADYYMFADQDDVWLKDKIQTTLDAMQAAEREKGEKAIVVHTDLRVVGKDLNEIAPSFLRYSNLKPHLIESDIHYLAIANCLTGCTIMLNRQARNIVLPFADNAYMHDQWIGIKTMLEGGAICFVNEPTMLYRQHDKNQLGAQEYRFNTTIKYKLWLAQRSYRASHPQVFRNRVSFWYWKTKYFLRLHTRKH